MKMGETKEKKDKCKSIPVTHCCLTDFESVRGSCYPLQLVYFTEIHEHTPSTHYAIDFDSTSACAGTYRYLKD